VTYGANQRNPFQLTDWQVSRSLSKEQAISGFTKNCSGAQTVATLGLV